MEVNCVLSPPSHVSGQGQVRSNGSTTKRSQVGPMAQGGAEGMEGGGVLIEVLISDHGENSCLLCIGWCA